MELSKEAIISKTHYGLNIYAHVLQQYYPGTVLSLSGRDCKPAQNPFNANQPTLLICIANNMAVHRDEELKEFKGTAFDFATLHYKLPGQELIEKLNAELHLRLGEEYSFYNRENTIVRPEVVETTKQPLPCFSYYKAPVKNTIPEKAVTLIDAYKIIRSEKFAKQTISLRSIDDKKTAKDYKAGNFDYVTFSGIFSKRADNALQKHSGLLTIDLDHINNADDWKDRLLQDEYFETELLFVPWRLDTPIKNELIVGVGAFRHKKDQMQYIGSAFSFDNTGGFNNFDYFMRHQTDKLAGCIEEKVKEFATVNHAPDRLIIHFYKELSRKELEPIERALDNLELETKIPVYIITVNKTEAEDIVAFDTEWEGLMPISGTYINIGHDKYLLFNNTRYSDGNISSLDGFPFPVKLSINCNEKNRLRDAKVIRELINQVYQFSRMYWKSIRQQNLPVTTKYPEMVAQIAPYFKDGVIPEYGKNNLWFL